MRSFASLGLITLLAACQQEMPQSPESRGTCIAPDLQHLIDKPVEVLDAIALPEPTRIIAPMTAVTMDYREDRLNIEYDDNRRITRVYCG